MGNLISSIIANLANLTKREMRILMVGLDNAGKTSILYKLKLGDRVQTIPTIGFNVESVQYKNINFTVWDVGGQARLRKLWKHYFIGSNAIIFVVDSCDVDRFEDARGELHSMMSDPDLSKAVLLVFANKQDVPDAVPTNEIVKQLALPQLKCPHWFVLSCCALNGNGLCEGFDWLSDKLLQLEH